MFSAFCCFCYSAERFSAAVLAVFDELARLVSFLIQRCLDWDRSTKTQEYVYGSSHVVEVITQIRNSD